MIACANMGDPNASIPTPQPTYYRPQFAAHGAAKYGTSITFVSQTSLDEGVADKLKAQKTLSAVQNCRKVTKADLLYNGEMPKIEVDAETYTVKADGEVLTCEPLSELPLAQRYFLF